MRLLVLGGTGKTGTQILDLALARGHEVTAFVRSPGKVAPRPRLGVVQGDPLDSTALRLALPGHDAVLSALGVPGREALRPSTRMTEFAGATVAAMTAAGVSRLGVVSAAVLFPEPRGLAFDFFRWMLKHHARDLVTMEAVVAASDLDWTIARPPRLVRGDDARYRTGEALPEGSRATPFRAVAAFLLDAIEQRAHLGRVVGVSR